MNKCIGCGIKLQDKYSNKLGYTKDLKNKYCERCFKTIHYNEERKVSNIDNLKIINKINKLGYFTMFITDLLNINNELISIFKNINNKKILVINKSDIIPNNLKIEHLIDNIKKVYNISEEIIFISAKKKYNLNKVEDLILENNNVIFCGETSSGKSTLINNLTGSFLTTSKYDNTTLDFIKIKYNECNIYDTPGILFNNSKEVTNKIVINTKQINNKYIMSIGNIKLKGDGNITIVASDKIVLSSKKDNSSLNNIISIEDNSDIIIPNGFIYVKNGFIIETNEKLEVRKSIIGR